MCMNNDRITSERFITLSREYADDIMGERRIKIKKEHYYIFAISNFIATKEYFMKKRINQRRTINIFDRTNNNNILEMMVEFYKKIKSNNSFREPPLTDIRRSIIIYPDNDYTDKEAKKYYSALFLFNEIRNSLSHAGNYVIKEINNERIVSIKTTNLNTIDVPVELFDFVAFYINLYINGTDNPEVIFQNYLIYKQSKDNKKYYNFESDNATNRIAKLVAKTKNRINKKTYTNTKTITRNRNGSSSKEYIDVVIDEFIDDYGYNSIEILRELEKANISDEEIMDILTEYSIIARANKRLSSIKIDKCINNIEEMLTLDRKSSSLYSHSIILFTNRPEPRNTNAQEVEHNIKKIIKNDFLSIEINDIEKLNNRQKKKIIKKYKNAMEKLLIELPNLIRINEHKYRNSIFHNNLRFSNGEIHFWNQKDNTNINDIHTFDIFKTPKIYNLELKNIENFNMDVGEISISELFYILEQFNNQDEIDKMQAKLWNVNHFDYGLLNWNKSINSFIDNLNKKLKEYSYGLR